MGGCERRWRCPLAGVMPTMRDMICCGVTVPGWLVAWQGRGDLPQLRAELAGFAPVSTAPWLFSQCFPSLSLTHQQHGSFLPYPGITDLGPSTMCRLCIIEGSTLSQNAHAVQQPLLIGCNVPQNQR